MNKTLLPKLRFPEFQDEWKSESLGNVYSFKVTNSFSRDQLNYENGSVKNIHYGDIHTKFSTLFDIKKERVPFINPLVSLEKIALGSYCIEGDIVFADASEDMNDVGKSIEIVNVNNEKLVSGMHTLLARQKEKKIIVSFGGYLFKSDRIRLQIKKEAQGAKVYGISANRLLNIDICFPSDEKEQQKIADCLTSLDDLIAAQSQKVEALQAYKKGLMQNLFPAEGESVPRLRFPEFESAGEWEAKTLGELGDVFMCKRIFAEETNGNEGVPFFKIGTLGGKPDAFISKDLFDEYKTKYNFPRKGEILITCSGTVGKCLAYDGSDAYYQDSNIVWIDNPTLEISNEFLHNILLNVDWGKLNSTTIIRIYMSDLRDLSIVFPVNQKEQQRIAELLGAVDEEISAQGEAVAALKVHKKGLMQGLFA